MIETCNHHEFYRFLLAFKGTGKRNVHISLVLVEKLYWMITGLIFLKQTHHFSVT